MRSPERRSWPHYSHHKRPYHPSSASPSPSRDRPQKAPKSDLASLHEAINNLTTSLAATNSTVDALAKHVYSNKAPAPPTTESYFSDPPEDEDYENSEDEPSYDPHNPSAGLDDDHSDVSDNPTPSCSTDVKINVPSDPPSPSNPDSEFYFWPNDVELYREFVHYRGHKIPYYSGDIYVTIHDGAHVFSLLSSTSAVQALVNGSSRVVAKPDLPDSRQEHFKALAKIVNTGGYRKFNLESSSSHNLTLNSRQISRFLGSLKSSHSSLDPQTPKPMPFSLCPQPGTEEEAAILTFASAPKLPKNAHKLDGLLAGYTSEVPDTLRMQDFQARQLLHGLLMSHELLKFQENIAHQAIPSCKEPCVKDISRVIGSGSLPLLQTLISNQVLVAKQICLQLRTKAASSVRTHSVLVSLIYGSLFSAGLFDQAVIAKAEDYLKHTPQTVVVQQPSFRSSGNPRQHTPSYSRDGPARSSFHRYKGKGSQYQRRSAPVYIPTRQGKASSGKNKGFANKGKGRQQNFRSQQQGPSGHSQTMTRISLYDSATPPTSGPSPLE